MKRRSVDEEAAMKRRLMKRRSIAGLEDTSPRDAHVPP
jgi:hypothetical protein